MFSRKLPSLSFFMSPSFDRMIGGHRPGLYLKDSYTCVFAIKRVKLYSDNRNGALTMPIYSVSVRGTCREEALIRTLVTAQDAERKGHVWWAHRPYSALSVCCGLSPYSYRLWGASLDEFVLWFLTEGCDKKAAL